eukprot:CAMPEP_0117666838 /NCGR_PEP_ID=MMETSP0804-20121206/10607_1 /TAXON_ID=1074897 /ORGANISM="Tetraselmis astigmatica, Strain CCMP880" /LENGTH=258 /DNA_ID=CAMNT_0005474445 /DNA_START=1 /DNA_END=777 /DNA_ORIENTATION=+
MISNFRREFHPMIMQARAATLARSLAPYASNHFKVAPSATSFVSRLSIRAMAGLEGMAVLPKQEVVGDKTVLGKSRWLQLVDVKYTRGNQESTWQYCERCTRPSNCDVDAVCVFAILKHANKPNQLVIVKQFRPPLNKFTVELCAGLVDEGETVEEAALRELKEETGYIGKVLYIGGKQYLSPGLTNECVKTVFVEVDADTQTAQDKDDAGFISVETLPLDTLLESLEKLEAEGFGVWVGLHSIAQTLKLQSLISAPP